MSESQFVRKIEPQIKKSSLDGHQMLTPPPRQRQAQQGTPGVPSRHHGNASHATSAQAPSPGTDVVITSRPPIQAQMQPGGVVVKAPVPIPTSTTQHPSVTGALPRPTASAAGGVTGHARATVAARVVPPRAFAPDEIALLVSLVDQFGQAAGGAQLEVAHRVFAKLHAMAGTKPGASEGK